MKRALFAWTCALLLGAQAQAAPQPAACPERVPAGTRCFNGHDGEGARYWIAIPKDWNRVLVLHAHGGPELGVPRLERSAEDLKRWAVTVKAGYAWAGSTYRRGGYGVTMAAQDTERLRQLFNENFGVPQRTLLHGQSYGAGVAAKGLEMYGRSSYDGALLTSGVLGGGVRAYAFRLDLRVVYQYVCNNHPQPDEPQYPLWQGLPANATLTREALAQRVDECTGVRKPAPQRTDRQRANLETITKVVGIPERSLIGHLNWATWLFQDLSLRVGGNAFDNTKTRYLGSTDDSALNAAVMRYAADPRAVQALEEDSRPSGKLQIPVLGLHANGDPTASPALPLEYAELVHAAGASDRLVQVFTDEEEHSYLGEPQYPALFDALLAWVERGDKPSAQGLARACKVYEVRYGAGCRIQAATPAQAR
jgi:alpha-beta hydrolase superfamily lysophospholipase